ncbi:hypothetical protein BDQ17DRAFT_1441510 [Cyathus striatus]|nr:hypothetical protein BDQ17DRAFT_1441510 [Cyathus striatus]
MKAYKTSQTAALEAMRVELETSNKSQLEIDEQITSEIATLKEQNSELTERRKDLWREDTKLDSLVSRAADELKSYERALASMMDKDTGQGLRAVDSIAERYKLDGVYGPLYRLFEVVDPKFNIAVELTAGNRY